MNFVGGREVVYFHVVLINIFIMGFFFQTRIVCMRCLFICLKL